MLFEIGENVMQDKQSLLKHVMAREGALARAGQTGKTRQPGQKGKT